MLRKTQTQTLRVLTLATQTTTIAGWRIGTKTAILGTGERFCVGYQVRQAANNTATHRVARWAIDGTFNKESKIYIGAPASPEQANPGSYVDIDRLAQIVRTTRGNETIAPYFGGVMLWEAGGAVSELRHWVPVRSF